MLYSLEPPPKAYTSFKKGAIDILERMLAYTLWQGDNVFRSALRRAEQVYSHSAVTGSTRTSLQESIMHAWEPEIAQSIELIKRLNQAAYVLSKTSENEARARIVAHKIHATLTPNEANKTSRYAGAIEDRIKIAYEDQAAKIARAIRIGKVLSENPQMILARIRRTYPPLVKISRKKIAKPPKTFKEAADDETKFSRDSIDADFYDEDEWNKMVDMYKETELWEGRFSDSDDEHYKWQYEQEAVEDFVGQVRSGEDEASNQGIDDFVWASVIDKKTCEKCCVKRDGLLVSEIEAKLSKEWMNDECKAKVPPAHINCRCQLYPVSSQFLPEDSETSFTGIDEWLASPTNNQGPLG